MLRPLAFLALALLAAPAFGSDTDTGTALVPNNHGGYNVVQPGAPGFGSGSDTPVGTALVPNNHGGYNVVQPGAHGITIPFFGSHGFAAKVIEHSHDPKSFVMVAVVVDDGHGKHTVYKRVYYPTPEDAEAAKAKL
jgi:hypothetical protein